MNMDQVGPERHEPCPHCGEPTVTFNVALFSSPIRLEDHDVPVTADLDALHTDYRLWEHLGPRLGWGPKYTAVRTWRPLRATHRCADKQQHKNKNKKERQP